jgi:phosphohistidine phosphatase SixA
MLGFCLIGISFAAEETGGYTLYLVRHAEKQLDGSRDPVLTEAGQKRADQLANWFRDKGIRDVWSSDYHRTRDTAKPLLSSLGLELKYYDPGDLPALSKNLLDSQLNALIVGHSNTTPDLARLLCRCEIDDMDESEYDRLIVILIGSGKSKVKILRQ